MAKLLKIVAKSIISIFEWVLILLIVTAFAIRTSPVQTYLAEVATDYLSKELETELHIDKVDIYFFDRLALDGVFVRDQQGDTLASLGSIEVVLRSLNLNKNQVTLRNIALEEGKVGISRDSLTGDYNYWFISDYFSSGPSKKKKKPMALTIQSLTIDHVDVDYDDYRKSYSDFGMDYDHLSFDDVVMHADDFKIDGTTYYFRLEKLSTKEKCGLDLRRLKTNCQISDRGIYLTDVKINTSRSRIYSSHFYMKMNGLKSVYSFTDSVTFDAVIDSSSVNLTDISYFAPALEGMYQNVDLRAELHQKVRDLKIANIDLRTGQRTIVRGTLLLPDFRALDGSFLKENLQYAYIDLNDLKALRLPDDAVDHFIQLDPSVSRLGYFEVKKLDLIGYWSQFVMSSRQISTSLGTVHLDNGLLFTELNEGGYEFERSANSNYDVLIDSFNLGKFIADPMFGKVSGSLFLSGVVGQKDIIRLNKLDGEITSCGFNNYNYSNISVEEGSFINNVFDAKIDIADPHLALSYDGFVDLNKGQKYQFDISIPKADLGRLNFTANENTTLVTDFSINMSGNSLSNYSGTMSLNHFVYVEDSNTIAIPDMNLNLQRGGSKDIVTITSDVANATLEGKVNPNMIVASLNNMLSGPLSTYFQFEPIPRRSTDNNFFDLELTVNKADEVLAVFMPELVLASGTHLTVHYNALKREAAMTLNASQVMYDSIVVRDLAVDQSFLDGIAKAEIDASYFGLNDSLYVQGVDIDIDGTDNVFNTVARWNENRDNPAEFKWKTTLSENNRVDVLLKPSYFTVKSQMWEIMNSSELIYQENRVDIDHLVLEREAQFIAINGVLSDKNEDVVTVNINDLQLNEFSSFLTTSVDLEGKVNGDVRISNPFKAFHANGDLSLEGLIINDEPIGDVVATGLWDNDQERMVMNGELLYLKNKTFTFVGDYYPYREVNNVDFDLEFDDMDLQFANAFVDPTVVRDIRGKLRGDIQVTGNIESPVINGLLKLNDGNVRIDLLGVNYKLSGPIDFNGDASAFYIDNMPLVDEEGNKAFLTAAINHTNFENWNCDIGLNIEDDYSKTNFWGAPSRIEKFLVLNTRYKEGDIYYGRAYVTGTANIFVTEENVDIAVDVRTEKGTWIDLPMYGNSEIEEGKFIRFEDKEMTEVVERQLDLTGLNLDLNFDITPDARVKLIFNDKTGDEITATGRGDLNIRLNNQNDLVMLGQYTIGEGGRYNFVMGPIKQNFFIREGGTITWTGDPYNANLDLRAYNPVKANLNEITQDVIEGGSSSSNQDVYCYMIITETLNEPLITLDIQAPNASESGKAILNRIRSDKDELQKQFFSLLLFKKFSPLSGQTTAGSGGIADVVANQINSILDGLSDEVKLNVAYDGDDLTGNKSYEVGVQRSFGQNKNFIVKGSFGVANTSASGESQSQTNLIGDMSLEYLINDDGTFRVNIFNESNDNSVIQDKTQGLFTQGVGFHYQEDFNSMEDFKLIQVVLDLFRKEKKVKIKKRRHEVSVDTPLDHPKPQPPVVIPEGNPAIQTEKKEDESEN